MTIEAVPEVSGDREILLKRIHELVRKEVKFDPESRAVSIPEVIQRINEKNLFNDKAFGAKLKDDIIKILLTRQSKIWQVVKHKDEGKDQEHDLRLDELVRISNVMEEMITKSNTTSEEKLDMQPNSMTS